MCRLEWGGGVWDGAGVSGMGWGDLEWGRGVWDGVGRSGMGRGFQGARSTLRLPALLSHLCGDIFIVNYLAGSHSALV